MISLLRISMLVVALLGVTRGARAHDFNPGVLALVETSPGRFTLTWTEPVDSSGAPGGVRVRFPAACRLDGVTLECGQNGLAGELSFDGMHESRMQVVIAIEYLDGTNRESVVTGANPKLEIASRSGSRALFWLETGARHIAGGIDHLAFVLGLLLVARRVRDLLLTITAFTLAHSLTLALATIGWVRLPALAVEAVIAASVVLVAREAMRETPTWTRRAPWAVALAFGLVHGLGFAGALREIGLPERSFGWALFWFNLGVELAQLLLVSTVTGTFRLLRRRFERFDRFETACCYALGGIGAWLLIERVAAMFTARS